MLMQEILEVFIEYKYSAVIFQRKKKWLPAGEIKACFTEEVTPAIGLTWRTSGIWIGKVEEWEWTHSLFPTNIYLLLNLSLSFGMARLAITICLSVVCEVRKQLDSFFTSSGGERGGGHRLWCSGFSLPRLLHCPGNARKGKHLRMVLV